MGAQIISLDIKHYVPSPHGLQGVLGYLLGRTKTQKNLGLVVLGFGLMFYGLEAIDDAMRPFRTYQPFIDLMQTLGQNPLSWGYRRLHLYGHYSVILCHSSDCYYVGELWLDKAYQLG